MQIFKVFIAALSLALVIPASANKKEDKFKMMDTNNDGRVSEDEYEESSEKKFKMLDANKDGALTVAELEEGHEKMKDKKKKK